mmetsp:Transcript_40220/g.96382  ORF Transcript_40220/g.96382 Transcript_40220/m.96382 type:complete len:601 (+) Transcript_40220:150-1952(+)
MQHAHLDVESGMTPARKRWSEAVLQISELRAGRGTHALEGRPWQLFVHFAFVLLLYITVTLTIPISQVAEAKRGVDKFAASVSFEHGGGIEGEGNLQSVSNVYDSILYGQAFIQELLTNDEDVHAKPGHKSKFFLEVNRLINSIVVVQRRVKPSDCSYPAMKPLYKQCFESLEDHEIKSGHLVLKNGRKIPYSDRLDGFAVELPLSQEEALSEYQELMEGGFWDTATREFNLRFAFHNSPGHYTSNVDIHFAFSPYGEVEKEVESAYMRLKPYSKEVEGSKFALFQLVTLGFAVVLFGHYASSIYRQPHCRWGLARALHPWHLTELLNYILIGFVIYLWFQYIQDPRRTSMRFDSTKFQDIGPLAEQYFHIIFLMAVVLLLWTVRTIEFFSFVGGEKMKKVSGIIEQVVAALAPFALIVAVVFVGFVCVAHVIFGSEDEQFDGPLASLYTLLIWFVSLGGGHRASMDVKPGGFFFMIFFIMICMVLLFNMFIALVMAAHDEVMSDENELPHLVKPMNYVVADWVCDQLGVSPYLVDPYNSAYEAKGKQIRRVGFGGILDAVKHQLEREQEEERRVKEMRQHIQEARAAQAEQRGKGELVQ